MAKGDYGKRNFFIRYFLVIKCLRNRKKATFDEIREFIAAETAILDKEFIYEIRTFQRDLNDIRCLFGIDIKINRLTHEYTIVESETDHFNTRILESFDIFNLLSSSQDFSQYISLERKCKQGTEYLHGLLYAINNRFKVSVLYKKYYEQNAEKCELLPLALKEFKARWYLIAARGSYTTIRTYALDRIQKLIIQPEKYIRPQSFDVNVFFKDCFGIIRPEDDDPYEIILSFDPFQGNYLKSYPLHTSQEILIDNNKEFRIKLFVFITYDLMMELLSFGNTVRIHSPLKLKKEIRKMTM